MPKPPPFGRRRLFPASDLVKIQSTEDSARGSSKPGRSIFTRAPKSHRISAAAFQTKVGILLLNLVSVRRPIPRRMSVSRPPRRSDGEVKALVGYLAKTLGR